MATPRPKKTTAAPAASPQAESFDDWDALVAESHVDRPPYRLRVRKEKYLQGDDPFDFVTIPVPSGAAYINLNAAQQRSDVASILVNLTTSGTDDEENTELFNTLMRMLGKADFPVVDNLAARVLAHYFNAPPKAADGSPGGPGESSAS